MTELLNWKKKLPKRWNCKYPDKKCWFCNHEEPCVPDYADDYREDRISTGILKFIMFIILMILLPYLLFIAVQLGSY